MKKVPNIEGLILDRVRIHAYNHIVNTVCIFNKTVYSEISRRIDVLMVRLELIRKIDA